jgi:S-adenosylmethionine/arginine decarboxylase-like enzyme
LFINIFNIGLAFFFGFGVTNIYVPQGASVTVLISEGPIVEVPNESYAESPGPLPAPIISDTFFKIAVSRSELYCSSIYSI